MFPAGDIRVVIVGGGATGALLACHLLREPSRGVRVMIIEKSAATGLGLAYGTLNPRHLLNVRALNMSAFPDQPHHFWDWLVANNLHEALGCDDAFCFVPREIYGQYLASLLRTHLAPRSPRRRLDIVRGECVSLRATRSGVEARLADGSSQTGHLAVLATGNEAPAAISGPCKVSPWSEPTKAGVRSNDAVLIIGSGLTMVDYVLSLLQARHRGPILAISRHGLLPHVHRHVEPKPIDRADVPIGAEVSGVLKWLRELTEHTAAQDQDWRTVVDGLRPFTQDIWQRWPVPAKHRFLRHARVWWDVHRHRAAPEADCRIKDAIARGQLKVAAGRVKTIEVTARGATVTYGRRGTGEIEVVRVDKIVQCIGVSVHPYESSNPALRSLLRQGLARPDPIGIGIDVTADCAVIDRSGRPSQRLLAVGPLTRGKFWEIVAIPDIRVQCAELASRILGRNLVAAE
jgi:uncharacterized NAD(P)/FAD-binding protein YdhS